MSANAIFKGEEDFYQLPNNASISKVYRGKKSGKKNPAGASQTQQGQTERQQELR